MMFQSHLANLIHIDPFCFPIDAIVKGIELPPTVMEFGSMA